MNNVLETRIEVLKQQFYNNHKKSVMFKSSQKLECNSFVASHIGLHEWLPRCLFPYCDGIYMDYIIFKQCACPEQYADIFNGFTQIMCQSVANSRDKKLRLYLNMSTLTVSALSRFDPFARLFLKDEFDLYDQIEKVHIFYCSHIMEMLKPLIVSIAGRDIVKKIIFYDKTESFEVLKK
jgi:hypothetical protein